MIKSNTCLKSDQLARYYNEVIEINIGETLCQSIKRQFEI